MMTDSGRFTDIGLEGFDPDAKEDRLLHDALVRQLERDGVEIEEVPPGEGSLFDDMDPGEE